MSISRVFHSVVAATVLFVAPASALAQEVGIKAGANFASLTPEEDEDPEISRRRGLVAGGWFRTQRTARLSFQFEGLFSEKGVRFDGTPLGLDGDLDVRIRYVEIPLLARGDFGDAGSTARVFVVGGVAPAFRLSARSQATADGEEHTVDNSDDIKPFDLGLVGGVGVAFGPALIEARYTHGILHINEDDNGDEDRIKNRVFTLSVGFRLR